MTKVTRRGHLQDFIPRPGDPAPTIGRRNDSAAQKWGGRYLLSDGVALNNQGVSRRQTVINTGDLGIPTPVNVQLRWANNVGNREPVLPFVYPLVGGAALARIIVRRGVDGSSSPTEDIYNILTNDVFPIDTITARNLTVDVEMTGFGSGSTVWVEAIAAPVHDVGPKNQVFPWSVPADPIFVATNPAAVSLLAPNSQRVQFFICNTSTDADLMVQLGRGPALTLPQWLPTPLGTFVLPRNMFAVYESQGPFGFKGTPSDGVRGSVYGIWSNAGNGGALIHEGLIF